MTSAPIGLWHRPRSGYCPPTCPPRLVGHDPFGVPHRRANVLVDRLTAGGGPQDGVDAAAMSAPGLTAEERDESAERAKALDLKQCLKVGCHGPWWTEDKEQLLGTDTDRAIAATIEKTREAVRCIRCILEIPNAGDQRRR